MNINPVIFEICCAFEDQKISLAQARAMMKDAGVPEDEIDTYLFEEEPGE